MSNPRYRGAVGVFCSSNWLGHQSFLNVKTVLFWTIQLCLSIQFSSIWSIDRTLSGPTTPGHSGLVSDGNKGGLRIPQSSSITAVSLSDCLLSYPGHLSGKSYPSTEMQLVYYTALADRAKYTMGQIDLFENYLYVIGPCEKNNKITLKLHKSMYKYC